MKASGDVAIWSLFESLQGPAPDSFFALAGPSRIQTVHADTNPRYHAVISKFKEKTGCPIVVNTSFNVRGEPIICSPTDAFKCFMGTEMDVLTLGNYVLYKEQQDEVLKENYEERYELD